MLDSQFIGTNLHFAVNLLAALVCFAVFWLIFDAWTGRRRDWYELLKWVGFLALSVGFLIRATATSATAGGLAGLIGTASDWLRLAGYLAVVLGQILEPLQEKPVYKETLPETLAKPAKAHAAFSILGPLTLPIPALLSLLVGALYLRRATTGLERHLAPVAWGFAGLAVFEGLAAISGLSTTNPNLYRLAEPLGPAWWAALIALTISSLVLGRWVWEYLTKRLQTQLFIILVAQTLTLFLFCTIGFTFLLLRNIQTQSLTDLTTASHVLDYAISSRQAETAAQAEAVASNQAVVAAVTARDHAALSKALATYLADHNLTSLTITDSSAAVLLRGEDPDRWGDSRSSDPLVRRGLIGKAASSVVVRSGAIAPTVSLIAASPIRAADGTIIGTATAGRAISNAFVDGIRTSTGLDSAVYGAAVRSATTLTTSGTSDRAIGTLETTPAVLTTVLEQGKSYSGSVQLQNRAYLAAYTPLKDINNQTVGMVLVAHPGDQLYAAANRSIQFTFLFVVGLILLSIYPVYLISRFLSSQLK